MNKVVEIELLDNYIVWLKFEDGFNNQINLKPFLGKGIAKDLLKKEKFETLHLESGGGISFDNGYDFCPNYLRMLMDKKTITL
ncbi:MAG: DUF2442 domain-containing protein [Polaribacter sp.]